MIEPDPQLIKNPLNALDLHKIRTGLAEMISHPRFQEDVRDRMIWDQCPQKRADGIIQHLGGLLSQASLFLWDNSIWDAAVTGCDVFSGTTWNQGEFSPFGEFHGFKNGYIFKNTNKIFQIPEDIEVQAKYVMIQHTLQATESYKPSTAFIVFFMPQVYPPSDGKWTRELVLATTPFIRICHALRDKDKTLFPYTIVSAMHEFLKLKLVVTDQVKLDRAERRRLKKANKPEPDLKIIRLRKTDRTESCANIGEGSYEWQYRWIVHGHWRKQWYPSMEDHAPKYISEYLKGPDGKPLMPPKRTIFIVNR